MPGTGEIFAFVQESVGGEVGGADQFSARIHGGTGEQVGACAKMGVRKNKAALLVVCLSITLVSPLHNITNRGS